MCPHTTLYVSAYSQGDSESPHSARRQRREAGISRSYAYMRLYMCPHTAICVLILLCILPGDSVVSSDRTTTCSYICVLILLYMCPHTAISSGFTLLYMCPRPAIYVSSYYYKSVPILLCPYSHATVYVSSYYYYIRVLILQISRDRLIVRNALPLVCA